MEFKSFQLNGKFLIGASFREGRVAVADSTLTRLYAHAELPADCRYGFDLSGDGRLLAVSYIWTTPSHIDLRELSTDCVLACAQQMRAYDIALSFDARYIVCWKASGKAGTWIYDVNTARAERVKGAAGPTRGTWTRGRRSLLLPSDLGHGRKAIHQITFDPLNASVLTLPARRAIWVLTANPTQDRLAMLESDATVACISLHDCEVLWRVQVPGAGWISHSGDGRFLAVPVLDNLTGGVDRMMVLDADSGQVVRTIDEPEQGRFPVEGPQVLCLSGRVANLETGELAAGASDPHAWHSLIHKPSE